MALWAVIYRMSILGTTYDSLFYPIFLSFINYTEIATKAKSIC